MSSRLFLLAIVILAIAACGAEHGSSVPGRLNGMCLAGDVCNAGLVCSGGICVEADDPNVDGGKVPPTPVDATPPCADDGPLEPNDTIQTAFATGVDAMPSVSFGPLSICPAVDSDHFAVTISSMKSLEVVVSWPSGPAAVVSILSPAGTAIVNATPTSPTSVRACAPNLPAATYFARVQANAAVNSYTITLRIVASC